MRAAFSGSLQSALELVRSGELAPTIAAGFAESVGRRPHPDDITTWSEVLPIALRVAGDAIPLETHTFVECPLPFNGQRIDLLFLGGRAGVPSAHLIELKHWGRSTGSTLSNFVEVAGHPTPHPSYQVLNYAGKLKHLHSFGPSLNVDQSVMVVDGPDAHSAVMAPKFQRQLEQAPAFFAPNLSGLAQRLSNSMSEGARQEWIDQLLHGEYSQSRQLLQMVKDHQTNILRRATDVLAASGWGLTDQQLLVHDLILEAIEQGSRAVYCVSGGPGSGKSILAMHLFLESIGLNRRTILAVRNNRLNASLRHILQAEVTGAQGMIKFFSAGKAGVEDDSRRVADVLVCDEAQRLALRSANVFLRAPVIVLLYDQNQILNDAEHGTTEGLREQALSVGQKPTMLELPTPMRCRGGAQYLAWLDQFLVNPTAGPSSDVNLGGYEVTACPSPHHLKQHLESRRSRGRVGFLASFTRASGRKQRRGPGDLGLVRIPELDPPVRWLMDPHKDYVPFWVEGRSNDLDFCASIYGAQGFELDYAGLMWGNDLVVRGGSWALGEPADCYDKAPGARRLSTVMRDDPATAMTLLRNRYRILLSRGIFGTAIYAEDAETREFLLEKLGGFRY
jgi:DUF2075 family protein